MTNKKFTKEEKLLLDFCKTDSLVGHFLPELHVGRSQLEQSESLNPKAVDAVCILSSPHNIQFLGLGYHRGAHPANQLAERAWKGDSVLFQEQPVALIEVKSGKLSHSAIGQLLVYKFLFEQDWPTAQVEQLWIVAMKDDAIIRPACKEMDIHVWIKELQGV